MVNISATCFHDENAARNHVEAICWPDGPICPHCGSVDNAHRMTLVLIWINGPGRNLSQLSSWRNANREMSLSSSVERTK